MVVAMNYPISKVGIGEYLILVPITNIFEGYEYSIWDGNMLVYETRSVSTVKPHAIAVNHGQYTLKVISGTLTGIFSYPSSTVSPVINPGDYEVMVFDAYNPKGLVDWYLERNVAELGNSISVAKWRDVLSAPSDIYETPSAHVVTCRFLIIPQFSSDTQGLIAQVKIDASWIAIATLFSSAPYGALSISIVAKSSNTFRIACFDSALPPPYFLINSGSVIWTNF